LELVDGGDCSGIGHVYWYLILGSTVA
jgi:hypothetical protein